MGLFQNMMKPGPGVSPNAPRKTGLARLWELLLRDGGAFARAGLLALVSAVPFFVVVDISWRTRSLAIALCGGAAGGLLAMPQLVALTDLVLRSLRDEPGYWWHTYRRVWRRDLKASLGPGALFGALFALQLLGLSVQLGAPAPDFGFLALSAAGLALSVGLFTYVLPQLALLELPALVILKNALLLVIVALPQSLAAVTVQMVYWGVILWFWPYTLIVVLFLGLWCPLLCSQLIVYAGLNTCLKIEETLCQQTTKAARP